MRPRGRRAARTLTSAEDFRAVYRAGNRHVSTVAIVYVLPHESGDVRLGIPAGRRLGGAVARNRVRRRIREAFSRVYPMISGGADVVVVPQPAAAAAPFAEIVAIMRSAFGKSGILSADSRGAARPAPSRKT